ncbi:MAG: hypothetical protein GY940_24195 [bacterium]|nr:hypothetical protein [bacterium]
MKKKILTFSIATHFILDAILGVMLLSFTVFPLPAGEKKTGEIQETIVENVTVSNVQVPVRVFKGKHPVDGLTKTDFHLYINGQKHEINGFYQLRKKLELTDNSTPAASPTAQTTAPLESRSFILIFNLSDYHQELAPMIDYLFKHIVRPGDRLTAITNRHFFPEWEIESLEKTKAQIADIVAKEIHGVRRNIVRFENALKVAAATFKSDIAWMETQEEQEFAPMFRAFFRTHRIILEDMKDQILTLPMEEYIKTARYLSSQAGDKYVLNFFQVGRIPMVSSSGQVNKIFTRYSEDMGDLSEMVRNLERDFLIEVQEVEDLLVKDIGKAFLNCGATFHTMLLKPMQPGFSDDFKYSPVTTDTEIILKRLSHLTGGSVITSNKMPAFAKKITAREDIVYMLTYAPDSADINRKKSKLTVKVAGNQKYRIVYDDQKRIKAFRIAKNKIDKKLPDLEIEKVSYSNAQVNVKLNNIKMVNYDGETFGALKTRVYVKDKNKKTVAKFTKTYRGIKKAGVFLVKLPNLDPGRYDVVLEVKDLFSMDNIYVGDAIRITQK